MTIVAVGGFLSGAALAAPPTSGPVLARAGEIQVTLDQLERPLLEAYGLNILLNLTQLELVKNMVAKTHVTVTPDDIARERQMTIENMFTDSNRKMTDKIETLRAKNQDAEAQKLMAEMHKDNEKAFDQFLADKHIGKADFDIVNETNAYLRKLAEPLVKGKITDQQLKDAFGALYGEKVKCRHIQCANLQEIQEAKRRLGAGDPFAKVAMEMSRNPSTGPLGGRLEPFTLQVQGLPETFKAAAFALKPGEVSDIVQAEGSYHLILLEERIPPKVVKFDDVKESIRADMESKGIDAMVKGMRQQLADQAAAAIVIEDPVLKKQWEERLAKRDAQIKDREAVRKQLEKERPENAAPATSQPAVTDLSPAK